MSRGQESQVLSTAEQQNQQFNTNAQTSYNQAQTGVTDYQNQLSQYAAANPYNAGGEFQTSQNKVLANTSDAAAVAAGQTMQGQAVRTGQNAGSAIAATQTDEQANERNLSADQATQNAARISNQAGYNDQTLKASEVPATLETALSGQQSGAGNTSLETGQKAAEDPSFLDTLGSSFAKGLGGSVGGAVGAGLKTAVSGCWIAARLWGGWNEPRTVLMRLWLALHLSRTWYGRPLVAAYSRWGERVADRWMPQANPGGRVLTLILRMIFEASLGRAEIWSIRRAPAGVFASYKSLEAVTRRSAFAADFTERDISNHVLNILIEWHTEQPKAITTAGSRFVARILSEPKGGR